MVAGEQPINAGVGLGMAETNGRESASSDAYATTDDFERIFTDMGALYLLSFLLTGSSDKAEECFAAGMREAANGNPEGVGAFLGSTHHHSGCDPADCATAALRDRCARLCWCAKPGQIAFGIPGRDLCDS